MESTLALSAFVDKKDGRVTCRIDGSDKTVRLYPIDVREIAARGTSIQFPPFTKSPKSASADAGDDGGSDGGTEPVAFDFSVLDIDDLKAQYSAALESGLKLDEPKGSHGKPWYVKVLNESGFVREVPQ